MKNKKKYFAYTFMIICLVGILITGYLLINTKNDTKTNLYLKQNLDKYVEQKEDNHITINFDELKKINSDTVGYINIPNTNVDYVVVKGKDNNYYLKHNFNNKSNIAGWIFADYRNKVDGTDNNLIIYGHETHDESMFGSLPKLLKEENIKDINKLVINFITDKSEKQYQIFSIYTIKPEDYYLKTDFKENEFERFKEEMKERSIYNIDIDLNNKKMITLSTCQKHGAKRLAVHAVEI